ncbi:hypothetical protein BHE74_00044581 [Ensete ventricosum]|nr:hypothetical protein BHE74_00044581 [Ensete ventricosum]
MLRPSVTQEWVDEGELPRERTKNRRWRRPYDVLAGGHTWRSRNPSSSHENLYAMKMSPGGDMVQRIENRIGVSHATRWRRQCMRVAVCLSIDQGELLEGHSGVEAGDRKGRGSDDESSGTQLPKSKASVRKEVDSEERHNVAEADLSIVKEGTQMQGNR